MKADMAILGGFWSMSFNSTNSSAISDSKDVLGLKPSPTEMISIGAIAALVLHDPSNKPPRRSASAFAS
jgi:hypothetical protein